MFLFLRTSLFVVIFFNVALSTEFDLETKLTHYQSFGSPFYDASISASKASLIDLENSIARASFLTTPIGDLETKPKNCGFLAHIQVGSKLLNQYVFMDTTSGLLSINCEPCGHKENSSSGFCDTTGVVKGYVARDSIKFEKTEDIFPEIGFGCTNSTANGILGLMNNNPMSLLSQVQAPQFAYCFGNISDKEYRYNGLVIGDGIALLGTVTPIIVEDKFYLTLESIKFGDKSLDFDAGIFKRNSVENTGGMILDPGTTYTFMPRVVVDKIEAEIIAVIGTSLPRNHDRTYGREKKHEMLCYDGILSLDIDWRFPVVIFQFQGDASFQLSDENMFRQMDDKTFCLVVLPSEIVGTTVSVLGNVMQQYNFFACDLSKKLLAFERMECDWAFDDDY